MQKKFTNAHDEKKGPFEVINCGAIPENLLESELFGHVKGAFTGATQTRNGRFQEADGGTLFLDEIGEMPIALQAKLLRVLEDQLVTKVGDSKPQKVDIRILAATHRDLEDQVANGQFREDLFYRLNVIQLELPALRDRGDDIIVITLVLLAKYATEYGQSIKGFTGKALTSMQQYTWPGNVRQLENKIKRAVVLCDGSKIKPEDLDFQKGDFEVCTFERSSGAFSAPLHQRGANAFPRQPDKNRKNAGCRPKNHL